MNDAPAAPAILRPGVTLYLVRHGETDWNREARYQGQRDVPLNDAGRVHARRNGRVLRAIVDESPDIDFVSSPLIRAIETMRIMRSELALDPDGFRIDGELRELHYGHWEGELAADLPRTDPVGVAEKLRDPFGWRPRGGESYQDLGKRTAHWLQTLTRDAIAVTHGGVSRVARGAVLGLPPREIPFLEAPHDRILVLTSIEGRWI